ncbi:hypothetical protein J2T41_004620 [Pseudomonas citronellolis]|uniref:DUF2933 domain-containing protein n=1 Tax=Pseudomonas citronellolis TaxID=53408 RepID=UPI00209DFD9B|nr:DUF2933 domain-containing protein [Pseudomonas citronellolis]MCP1644978.1 hypothetical protein [Pseudomonas citronellolis]MCP1668022.1 hypothetical protein [Pseudomonas citronellolis]MCP1699132.1 hypothetical protein [Pseudomonas citronellolis]MCP1705663.1 hypothetical protein [Pseudomonas citronellolis]MCP1799696.1 hypothetical protein [Pseudomonas citronellolis]
MDPHPAQHASRPRFWRSRYGIGLLVIGAIAGYFLLKERTAHMAGYLPYLLLAACPLMHVFMHRGHGHGQPASHDTAQAPRQHADGDGPPSPGGDRP